MVTNKEIVKVRGEPLTLLLKLPDGCDAGRWEAAVAFGEIVAELRRRYPGKTFQLLPFSFYQNTIEILNAPALAAMLAIAN